MRPAFLLRVGPMGRQRFLVSLCGVIAFAALCAAPVAAAEDNFFNGETITLISSSDAGGTAGTYARLAGDFLGRHIPGEPTVVIQFMPGAGGVLGASYCANRGTEDGLTICAIQPGLPHLQLLDPASARFDVRAFHYLGRTSSTGSAIYVTATSPAITLEDVRTHRVILGATGRAADTFIDPTIINAVLGTQFELIVGYPGGGEIDYAIETGEVEGDAGPVLSTFLRHPDWIDNGRIRFLVQTGASRHPRLPDVPLLTEFARNADERAMFDFLSLRSEIGYTLLVPEGVPADRVAILRRAMADMLADPEFLAAAERIRMDIFPATGEQVEASVAKVFATPEPVLERLRTALELN
jgi:tripartite-type tricarboxylate transporter receptor subunit TctC